MILENQYIDSQFQRNKTLYLVSLIIFFKVANMLILKQNCHTSKEIEFWEILIDIWK